MNEFSLIDQFFKPLGEVAASTSPNVVLGIGDDCALLANKADHQLAVSVDTLVAGVHFPENTNPIDLGYKCLAVNLSDLAAMGAIPAWFTLCVTLPEQDPEWLKNFARGLSLLSQEFKVPLVGGDTTKGPLTISLQVAGWVPEAKALKRSGAQPDDVVYVAGDLGWPFLGLQSLQNTVNMQSEHLARARSRFLRPVPQVVLGEALRGLASAAIDISDGLTADLGHILKASGVGAQLNRQQLPLAAPLHTMDQRTQQAAVNFGDEYQLLFTAPQSAQTAVIDATVGVGFTVSAIGKIIADNGLWDENGEPVESQGYQHF